MDELLMRFGEARWCADCSAVTIYVPVDDPRPADDWCCTSCDAAVLLVRVATSAA